MSENQKESNKKETMAKKDTMEYVAQIISAYVSKNLITPDQMHKLIVDTYNVCAKLEAADHALEPAVPIKKSVHTDYIICLEDGKKLQMLSRYLKNKYNLTPEQYKTKWNLPADYPMIAPKYAEQRRQIAKKSGLGAVR